MNTSSHKLFLTLTLFALLAGSALGQWQVGQKLPPLSTFGLGGVLPANLAGKIVLIDFWASWCGPCKKSFPALNELHQTYASQGLIILAINVDDNDAQMKRFLKDNPATFSIVRDATQTIVEAAGVEAMPSSFLIDSSGMIRFTHSGFREESTLAELTQEIEALLGKGIRATP